LSVSFVWVSLILALSNSPPATSSAFASHSVLRYRKCRGSFERFAVLSDHREIHRPPDIPNNVPMPPDSLRSVRPRSSIPSPVLMPVSSRTNRKESERWAGEASATVSFRSPFYSFAIRPWHRTTIFCTLRTSGSPRRDSSVEAESRLGVFCLFGLLLHGPTANNRNHLAANLFGNLCQHFHRERRAVAFFVHHVPAL
jgi:hypothetical protein